MKYLSTRGGDERLTFEEAVLQGLAPNGGLYVPERIPALPADWQDAWATLPFPELAFRIASLFVPPTAEAVSYTHLTLPTIHGSCGSRWSPYH